MSVEKLIAEIVAFLQGADDQECYEKFVASTPSSLIRLVHDSINNEEVCSLRMAIQTYIAIGEELGARMELEFPEYKGANPKYSFPNVAV